MELHCSDSNHIDSQPDFSLWWGVENQPATCGAATRLLSLILRSRTFPSTSAQHAKEGLCNFYILILYEVGCFNVLTLTCCWWSFIPVSRETLPVLLLFVFLKQLPARWKAIVQILSLYHFLSCFSLTLFDINLSFSCIDVYKLRKMYFFALSLSPAHEQLSCAFGA